MLDSDLAEFYCVTTKRLNEQVRRNIKRFPENFMFQLTEKESEILRSQIETSSIHHGGRRYLPYVFSEQGVVHIKGSGAFPSDLFLSQVVYQNDKTGEYLAETTRADANPKNSRNGKYKMRGLFPFVSPD